MKEVLLRILPLLTAALLAVLQLNLLHGGDELVGAVLVYSLLLKEFVVKDFPALEKQCYPHSVKYAAEEEDSEYQAVVDEEYDTEHKEAEHGEHHVEHLVGEERLHA